MRHDLCGENSGSVRGGYGPPQEKLDLLTVRFGRTPSGMRGGENAAVIQTTQYLNTVVLAPF